MMNLIELLNQGLASLRQAWPVKLIWLVVALGLGTLLVRADGPNQVGLVVVDGDDVKTYCVEFSEDELSGYEVLRRAGLEINADLSSGMGAAICRIDGQGCSYPAEDCFCQCQGADCVFWSYWQRGGDDWVFSNKGSSNRKARHGQVEGWVWGRGSTGEGGQAPPSLEFDDICAPPPPATPTPTPTPPPPTASPTHEPTATSTPTATPKPAPTPIIHHFSADRTAITVGESVMLSWDVSGADVAYLRYEDLEAGVIAPGSKTVSPSQTTRYALIARKDDGEVVAELTITVNPALPTPAVTQALVAAALPTATPAAPTTPVAEQPGEPGLTFEASALTATARAVGSGGEDEAQLAVQVTASVGATPAFLTASPGPAAVTPVAPTLAAAAVEPAPAAEPARTGPRRFTVSAEPADQSNSWLVYGGIALVLVLFVAAPLGLLGLGWVAWWLRQR